MSLEFTLVRRAISLAVIDGPDTGDNPDILKAQGSVLFEPVIKKGDSIQVQTRGGSETYALAPIECPINDGIISHRGQDGVKLPAGGEAANPSLIRWKATFSRMQAGGQSFTLAPVIFDAVPGGEIDLTMVAPVAGAPEGVVRGPRGTSLESIIVDGSELVFTAVDDAGSFEIARIPLDDMVRAEAEAAADGVRDALAVDVAASQSARDAAEGHADRAATSESNAAASESAAKQSEANAGDFAAVATTAATEAVDAMERATDLAGGDFATHEYVDSAVANVPRVDTTVGTRVFVGNTMIHGDTGLRRLASWDSEGVDIPDSLKDFEPSDQNLSARPGGIWIRRQGNVVTLHVAYAKALKDSPEIRPSPVGFGAQKYTGLPYPSAPMAYRIGDSYVFSTVEAGIGFLRFRVPKGAIIDSSGAGGYGVEITWHTRENWPTSLPGMPA